MHVHVLAAALVAGLGVALRASPATAAEPAWDTPIPFDTLYVTADRIPQPFLDVPRSVSVLTAGAIEDANIASVQEASEWIPNIHIIEVGARRLSFPYVRGVGSGEGNPAVATFIDGVPQLTVNTGGFDLLDVERIEFVRGPQGSLYGRNTLGGAIHVFSREPGPERRLGATFTTGDYARKEAKLFASGPLGDTQWRFGAAGAYKARDGFTTNAFPGSAPSVDGRQSFQGRLRLETRVGDQWDVRLSTHGERSRDGSFAFSDLETLRSTPHQLRHDFDGETARNIFGASLHAERAGDGWVFASTTAYGTWDALDVTDLDFREIDMYRRRAELLRTEFTQELRIRSSDTASPGRLGWVAGLATFGSSADHAGTTFVESGSYRVNWSDSDLSDLGVSAYGQATFSLSSSVDATAGLRYEHESKEATVSDSTEVGAPSPLGSSDVFGDDFDRWVPRIALAWHPGDRVHAYVQLAGGFKAGGYNESAPEGAVPFGPESSGVGEVGIKASWLEGRIVTSATAFGLEWDDMQLYVNDPRTWKLFYIDNAGQAKSSGFEAEITARLPGGAVANGSLGITRAEFEDYVDPDSVDCAGNALPFAPGHTWSLGLRHSVAVSGDLRLTGRLGMVGTGAYFYDAANSEEEADAQKINGGLGIRGDRWRAEIWGRNLADTHTIPVAFLSPVPDAGFVGQSGEPRTAGVTFSVTY